EHGGPLALRLHGEKQVGRHAIPFLDRESDLLADVPVLACFFEDLDVERHLAIVSGERPHDALHVGEDVKAAPLPVSGRLHRTLAPLGIADDEQFRLVGIERGSRLRFVGPGREDGQEKDAEYRAAGSHDWLLGRETGHTEWPRFLTTLAPEAAI